MFSSLVERVRERGEVDEFLVQRNYLTPSPWPSPSPFAKATADRQEGGKFCAWNFKYAVLYAAPFPQKRIP